MNIKKYIKECYEIAKSKGFYPEDSKIEDHLMGIVSELGEAYEAHRGGKFAPDNWDIEGISSYQYTKYLSGTFEDELADVFIRFFNLCGWLGIDNIELNTIKGVTKNKEIPMLLLSISHIVSDMPFGENKQDIRYVTMPLELLIFICKDLNIPIEKHIQAKNKYNITREHLHGKQY